MPDETLVLAARWRAGFYFRCRSKKAMILAVENLTWQRLLILPEARRDSNPSCARNGLIRFARGRTRPESRGETASEPLYDGLEDSLPAALVVSLRSW